VVDDIEERTALGRMLLSKGIEPFDLELAPDPSTIPEALGKRVLGIPFPDGLAPLPQPIDPPPDPSAPLPKADVVVITWTVDENDALADVLTPGQSRAKWYRYDRNFAAHYAPLIRNGAPAQNAQRLGSYFPTKVGSLDVLCMKSELHLNQDGMKTGVGTATLPVKDLFAQIVAEVHPDVVLTIGTAGSVFAGFQLGDVVVTRAAKFRVASEFRNEAFNGVTFKSDWEIPTSQLDTAVTLMQKFSPQLVEPPFGPPTKAYPFTGPLLQAPPNQPDIKLEQGGRDMPEFHPILTTDFFEYGTSTNHLDQEGAAVEMGDAALGLMISEMTTTPPKWAVVRNMSDPQINGDLPSKEFHVNMQTQWAVAYYLGYGYWTSVTGALAAWGILAGLSN
jgi:hypothetical protein